MKYICLDIETTDLDPATGDIIEVAAIKFEGDKIIDEFSTLLKPNHEISKIAKAVTGITDEMVAKAPELSEMSDDLKKFVGDLPVVGHNIDFDLGFLEAKGVKWANKRYDTWKLATILLPALGSHSLESLVSYLKFKDIESHRAMGDVKATHKLFLFLLDKIGGADPKILKEIAKLLKKREWALKDLFISKVGEGVFSLAKKNRKSAEVAKERTPSPTIKFNLDNIAKQFAQKGKLSRVFKNFEFRPNQIEMMKKVAETFLGEKHLVCEAGPGVGKSLAYLLPAVYFAKANHEKVLISTHTHNLQDQLLEKDIPIVRESVNFDFKVKKLVGRGNYLCVRRFEELKNKKKLSQDEITALIKILLWMPETQEGILDEIAWTFDEDKMKQVVNCNRAFCQKKQCPYHSKCFYYGAKKEAQGSDIVIVNHALLASNYIDERNFLDYKHLIIDEAHHLENSITSQLTQQISSYKINEYLDKLLAIVNGVRKKADAELIDKTLKEIDKVQNQTNLFFGILGIFVKNSAAQDFYQGRVKLLLDKRTRSLSEFWKVSGTVNNLLMLFEGLIEILGKLVDYLSMNVSDKSKKMETSLYDIRGYIEELDEIEDLLKEIIAKPGENKIYWLSYRDEQIVLYSAPLSVGKFLLQNLFKLKKTIILTSATLTTDQGFVYFESKLGLDDSFNKMQIPSHYEYKKQAEIIIPTDFPLPKYPNFNNKTSEVLLDIAKRLKGRTLALFTSYSAIRTVYKKLAYELRSAGIRVLAQGVTGGKMKILNEFKKNKKTILLGTSSFWEGVDIPGENLSCLIIAKLPFDVPSDPIYKARERQYNNGFYEYALPKAILTFKQGFGRLIRSAEDNGVVVLLDLRVENSGYGLKFLQALPEVGVEHLEIDKIGKGVESFINKAKS